MQDLQVRSCKRAAGWNCKEVFRREPRRSSSTDDAQKWVEEPGGSDRVAESSTGDSMSGNTAQSEKSTDQRIAELEERVAKLEDKVGENDTSPSPSGTLDHYDAHVLDALDPGDRCSLRDLRGLYQQAGIVQDSTLTQRIKRLTRLEYFDRENGAWTFVGKDSNDEETKE